MRLKAIVTKGMALAALGLALAAGAGQAQPPCKAPDNGTGTVTLPPAGCGYVSDQQLHLIIKGLPPGTTIQLKPEHADFFCPGGTGPCVINGGSLGGETERFGSVAIFQVSGTGILAGWNRVITIPLNTEVDTAPRIPGDPVQSFQTDMRRIQGGITGDPDFASLQIIGGTANGFPSPGSTTLTLQDDGSFLVDSSFNVGYSISFVGAAGGRLQGFSGTTTGTVAMKAHQ